MCKFLTFLAALVLFSGCAVKNDGSYERANNASSESLKNIDK
ncbi:hypothetical protein [Sulfurimonas sp.]|nr:hypothetical protein [Sulfurimonas sp.]MDD5158194.1 hypothetical protein [Sulfurimonas sp.]